MMDAEDQVDRLQEWILLEAYKNGRSGRTPRQTAGGSACEAPTIYFVCRHDVYQRHFRLPVEPQSGGSEGRSGAGDPERRLKSAAILCESLKRLLKTGLIQFHPWASAKKSLAECLRISSSFIFLTEEGVRKAESLFSTEALGPI